MSVAVCHVADETAVGRLAPERVRQYPSATWRIRWHWLALARVGTPVSVCHVADEMASAGARAGAPVAIRLVMYETAVAGRRSIFTETGRYFREGSPTHVGISGPSNTPFPYTWALCPL